MCKIAIICEYKIFPERIGGMDRFFEAYDKALKNEGFNPTWFFRKVELFNFYNNLNIKSAEGNNIETYFLKYISNTKIEFDIILTHFLQPVSSFFKKIKNQLPNSKIINIDHNPRPLQGFSLKKKIKNKIKGKLYGKYVDKLVGVSKYTSNYILKDFGFHLRNKTDTIYNGIDISYCTKQKINRVNKPMSFIVVSHLRESKGIQDLIAAIHKLDKTVYSQFKVDIFGEGPYETILKEMVRKFNLTEVINFKGSSPNIYKLLSEYNYLIQPTYMECFSLSLLESLACNVPVVTTDVGGNLELIKNGSNGFIYKPKDIAKLAEIINDLVEEKYFIKGDVSKLIEERYTLDIMVENHLRLVLCT